MRSAPRYLVAIVLCLSCIRMRLELGRRRPIPKEFNAMQETASDRAPRLRQSARRRHARNSKLELALQDGGADVVAGWALSSTRAPIERGGCESRQRGAGPASM